VHLPVRLGGRGGAGYWGGVKSGGCGGDTRTTAGEVVEPWDVDNVAVLIVVAVGVGVVVVGGGGAVVATVAAVLSVVAVDAGRRGAFSHLLKTTTPATLRARSGRRGGSAGGGLSSEVSTLSALPFHLYSSYPSYPAYYIYIYTSRPGHDAHSGGGNYAVCTARTHARARARLNANARTRTSTIVLVRFPFRHFRCTRDRLNVGS
jgi:hypothetical protein